MYIDVLFGMLRTLSSSVPNTKGARSEPFTTSAAVRSSQIESGFVRFHQGRDSQELEEEMAESKACHLAQDAQGQLDYTAQNGTGTSGAEKKKR